LAQARTCSKARFGCGPRPLHWGPRPAGPRTCDDAPAVVPPLEGNNGRPPGIFPRFRSKSSPRPFRPRRPRRRSYCVRQRPVTDMVEGSRVRADLLGISAPSVLTAPPESGAITNHGQRLRYQEGPRGGREDNKSAYIPSLISFDARLTRHQCKDSGLEWRSRKTIASSDGQSGHSGAVARVNVVPTLHKNGTWTSFGRLDGSGGRFQAKTRELISYSSSRFIQSTRIDRSMRSGWEVKGFLRREAHDLPPRLVPVAMLVLRPPRP
jgi:hypothetical protein